MKSMENENLDSFGLANFKSFKDLQELDIAPITLIYGQNSGGKTSLLSSLMCLGQSINEIHKGFFKTNSFLYDAGTFTTIKNNNSDKNEKYITIEFKSKVPKRRFRPEQAIYLNSVEKLLFPKFKLLISDNEENRSKLIISKIEINYEGYLSGHKLVFSKVNKKSLVRKIDRKYYFRRSSTPENKLRESAIYELEESSFKELNSISSKAVNSIAKEITQTIKKQNLDDDSLFKEGAFIEIPIIGSYGNSFYRVDSPFASTGLIKIAGILAGGWISNILGRYRFHKFKDKESNLISENTRPFINLIKEYVKDISDKNIDLFNSRNYIPSFYIDSSLERSRSRFEFDLINHIQIRYVENFDKELTNLQIKNLKKIQDKFYDQSISLIYDYGDSKEKQKIEAKVKTINEDLKNCLENFINFKNELGQYQNFFAFIDGDISQLEKFRDNFQVDPEKIKAKIKDVQLAINNVVFDMKEFTINNLDRNNELNAFDISDNLELFESIESDTRELENLFIEIGEKLVETEIENISILDINIIEEFLKIFDQLENSLSLSSEYFTQIKLAALLRISIEGMDKTKLIVPNEKIFYELMYFLFGIVREKDNICVKKNEYKIKRNYFYKKNFLSTNPLFSTTFVPYKLASEIVHLRAFRKGAKRAYGVNDINAEDENDVAFLIPIIEDENKEFQNRINRDLKELKIAESINIKFSVDDNYDFKSILLMQDNNKKSVNLVDTGYGISQVLPIIIHSNTSKRNTVIIQQPETHIHPRLQAEIASIISRSCPSNKNKFGGQTISGRREDKNFIIETHSETILLRLLKEIRKKIISKNDIKVYYVDKNKNGSEILEMEISEEGELISQWPEGFFSTEIDEMMD